MLPKFCVQKPFTELYSGVYKVPYYNAVKRERGSNFIFPIILKLLGEYQAGKGEGDDFGKENRDKNLEWGRISSCREFYTPMIILSPLPPLSKLCVHQCVLML